MRILHIQNLQLSHNNFDISVNDLNLENDQFDTSKRRLTVILIFRKLSLLSLFIC